ncbi:MFS transporter, partial [bacterium]|nr:MFS transporter [bacterium]
MIKEYIEAWRHAPPWFGRLLVGIAGFNLGAGVVWVGYNLYLQSLGYSDTEAGITSAMAALASLIFSFLVGRWIDRVGAGRALPIALVLFGAALAWRGLVVDLPWIYAAAFVAGLLGNPLRHMSEPLLALGSQGETSRRFALAFSVASLSAALGTWLGGNLPPMLASSRAGFAAPPGPEDFQAVFLLAAVAMPVAAWVASPLRHVHHARKEREAKEPPMPFRQLLKNNDGAVQKYWLSMLPIALGAGFSVPFFNLYLRNRHQLPEAQVGNAFTLLNVLLVLAYMLGPWLANRLGTVRGLVLLEAISVPFFVALALTSSPEFAVFAFVARGTLMNASHPLRTRVLMELVPASSRGIASALAGVVWGFGWVVGPPLSGMWIDWAREALGEKHAYTGPFLFTAALYAVAVALFWVWFRG